MKKIIIFILALAALPAAAEIVSEISFNPSRLGEYKFLKIAKDANFRGGLVTKNLNIKAQNTVSIQSKDINNSTVTITAKELKRSAADKNVSVNMSNATFQKSDIEGIPSILLGGGTLDFDNNNRSYISTICGKNASASCDQNTVAEKMDLILNSGGTLNTSNTVKIARPDAIADLSIDGSTVKGLLLAGNDIPNFRRQASDYHCNTSTCQHPGSTDLSSISGGTLRFVQRTTRANKIVRVLAIVK